MDLPGSSRRSSKTSRGTEWRSSSRSFASSMHSTCSTSTAASSCPRGVSHQSKPPWPMSSSGPFIARWVWMRAPAKPPGGAFRLFWCLADERPVRLTRGSGFMAGSSECSLPGWCLQLHRPLSGFCSRSLWWECLPDSLCPGLERSPQWHRGAWWIPRVHSTSSEASYQVFKVVGRALNPKCAFLCGTSAFSNLMLQPTLWTIVESTIVSILDCYSSTNYRIWHLWIISCVKNSMKSRNNNIVSHTCWHRCLYVLSLS